MEAGDRSSIPLQHSILKLSMCLVIHSGNRFKDDDDHANEEPQLLFSDPNISTFQADCCTRTESWSVVFSPSYAAWPRGFTSVRLDVSFIRK